MILVVQNTKENKASDNMLSSTCSHTRKSPISVPIAAEPRDSHMALAHKTGSNAAVHHLHGEHSHTAPSGWPGRIDESRAFAEAARAAEAAG